MPVVVSGPGQVNSLVAEELRASEAVELARSAEATNLDTPSGLRVLRGDPQLEEAAFDRYAGPYVGPRIVGDMPSITAIAA